MIELDGLTKRWPGAAADSVHELTLTVPEGTSCALIGPSGSGKTTTLRMVNRLIEPSGGRLRIAGQDALRLDAVTLRRSIGYVIQEVGLFPHWSIAENVATVPKLLGWPAARIAARVEEVLALTGLDPARFATRRPHQLSGGERQRVGVARALAGDPPVLLMDEPFGAVDPVVRGRLQEEVLRLLKTLRKTVLIVTHDLDEAVRARRRGGRAARRAAGAACRGGGAAGAAGGRFRRGIPRQRPGAEAAGAAAGRRGAARCGGGGRGAGAGCLAPRCAGGDARARRASRAAGGRRVDHARRCHGTGQGRGPRD